MREGQQPSETDNATIKIMSEAIKIIKVDRQMIDSDAASTAGRIWEHLSEDFDALWNNEWFEGTRNLDATATDEYAVECQKAYRAAVIKSLMSKLARL
jgi:hypothetical protein